MLEEANPAQEACGIETPEQVVLAFPIASLGSRCLALALDSLLLGAAWVAIAIPAAIVEGLALKSALAGWVVAAWLLFAFLATWGYFSAFEIGWRGQTPGKRLVRLRVIAASGHPASVGQILARNLVRMVDALPFAYSVGVVCMLLNRRSQRLGDLAAGTIVVHESEAALPPPVAAPTPAALAAIAQLNAADLQLLESFAARSAELPEPARQQLAERVRLHLEPRLPFAHRDLAASPAGLDALAAALRASLGYKRSSHPGNPEMR
jgi:uncharacterized RDD family membrane protein YckC